MQSKLLMTCALALLPFCATAESLGSLSNIQDETVIIKARAARAAAQADLAAKSRSAGGVLGASDAPVVKNVYGAGNASAATFLYSNGVTMEGKVGDRLIGDYKVVTISMDRVILMDKGGRKFPVGFSSIPLPSTQTPAVPVMPGR